MIFNKINKFTICFICILALANVATATDNAYKIDDQSILKTLTNGMQVLIIPDHRFPLASNRLYVRAGSTYEDPKEAGISHMLEHLVFKGSSLTPNFNPAQAIENVGGYINAETSFDYTAYLTDVPSKEWKLGLEVIRELAFHPRLRQEDLDAEREVVLSELAQRADNPGAKLFENLQTSALNNTVYAKAIIGNEQSLRSLTTKDIQAYIDKHYRPDNMLLVVVGDIDPEEVTKEAEELFGSYTNKGIWTKQNSLDTTDFTHEGNKADLKVNAGNWNSVYLGLAFPVNGINDNNYAALDILAQLLGGNNTSFFERKYRYNNQLIDSISVVNYTFERAGLFTVNVMLPPKDLEKFWNDLTLDFANLSADQFNDEEIERAKLLIEHDMFMNKESLAGLATKSAYFQFFAGSVSAEQNYISDIHKVDRKALQKAIDTWLLPQRMSLSFLIPEPTIKDSTASQLEKTLAKNWPSKTSIKKEDKQVTSLEVEEIDLGLNRKLVLLPDPTLPYASITLVMPGGALLLDADEQGLGALAATFLTKGTTKRTTTEIQDYLADRATGVGSSAGRLTFSMSMSAPTRFLPELLVLFNELLTEPLFDETEFERAKKSIIAQIGSSEDSAVSYAFRHMIPFLFPNSPQGYLQLGEKEAINNYTIDQVKAYWDKQSKQAWSLAVSGNFDRDEIIAFAKTLPIPSEKVSLGEAASFTDKKELTLNIKGRNQAHYFLIFPTVSFFDEDVATAALVSNVLSGQSGLLYQKLRNEQSLAYTVTALNWQSYHNGFIALYISTESSNLEKAKEGFESVIADLQNNLVAEELLQGAKNTMRNEYYRGQQSLNSRSSEAAMLTNDGYPLSYQKDIIEQAEQVNPERLQEFIQEYLQLDKAYTVQVLP